MLILRATQLSRLAINLVSYNKVLSLGNIVYVRAVLSQDCVLFARSSASQPYDPVNLSHVPGSASLLRASDSGWWFVPELLPPVGSRGLC